MKLLEGKTALVTGGTAGIGKAIVLALAGAGARVALFGTNAERGAKVCAEVKETTGEELASFHQVDVSSTQDVDTAIKSVLESFGSLDILVNNAGVTRDQLLMKMSEEDWDRVLEVNTKSCYNTCKSAIRTMMKARKGKIINISSVVGQTGNPGQTNYAASKAAIIGFTKALAKEVAARNINVNCVAPGFIETSMTEALDEQQRKNTLAQIPIGRMGTPDEIAQAVLFLSSNHSDYITGQVLTIDGGMVM